MSISTLVYGVVVLLSGVALAAVARWLTIENSFGVKQRKLVYAGAIVLLLIPIVYLGAPTSEDVIPGQKSSASGGVLARMRIEHDLGESTLGEIDPSSAAMNLVLLGLRGPAAGVLHVRAIEYQKKKDWNKLKATVDSIIKLQPHYVEIWKFQGWNLAFNVSREWDRVADRFYWVKEGVKFLQLGTTRNQTATMLYYNTADFIGRKFGNSDEKRFFRKFFKQDPDQEQFNGGADPEINPDTPPKDNYLVAQDWFKETNIKDEEYRIEGVAHVIARQGPARSGFDYARAAQAEGSFGEENRLAWDSAYDLWTDVYGSEIFFGLNNVRYKLNCSEDELKELATQNEVTLPVQRKVWEQNVKMVNFVFWRDHADCERDPLVVAAHKAIYDGKVAYSRGEISTIQDENGVEQPSEAEKKLYEGIEGMAAVFEKYPVMSGHDAYIEEAMLALLYWRKVHQYNGSAMPSTFPLLEFSNEHALLLPEIVRQFTLETQQGFD